MGMEVTKHHLTVPAQSWSLEELRDFCKRNLQISPVNQQDYRQLILAIDEVASNIVEHAYPEGEKKGDVQIDIDLQEDKVVIEIRDKGIPFNPLNTDPIDPRKSFSARLKRGYGIAIILRVIPDIRYERTDQGENLLTMTKLLKEE